MAQDPAGITFDAPLQQPTIISANAPAGITFDAPLQQPTTVNLGGSQQPQPTTQQPTQQQPQQATITAIPESTTIPEKVERWARNVSDDIKHGTDLTGVGTVLKKMGAHGVYAGQPEAVGDFMGSLPLGLAKLTQGVGELGQDGKRVQGAKDAVGGALQAATIPGSVIAPPGGAEVAGQAAEAGTSAAAKAVQAAKNYTSVDALQPGLQNSITSAFEKTAAEHGLSIPEGTTVRDVAQNLSDAVRAKAHGLYQQLDNALGGTRFQSFQDAVDNVQKAIRDEVGIDPEKDKILQSRLADAKAAKDAAVEQAQANGVPKTIIDQADKLHQQSMALQDVSKSIRRSADVHPSQLAAGADLTTATNVRTKPLFSKLQELATPNPKYPGTPSRLVQAIGEDRAAQLLHDVDQAHLAVLKIVERNAALAKYAKYGAGAVGISGGYEAIRSILGGK